MTKGRQLKTVTVAILVGLLWMTGKAGAAQCGSTAAGGAAGMTDTLVSYSAVQNSGYSDTNLVGRVLGDSDGRRRVEEMLQRQKTVVRGLLDTNQHLVAALRDALLERHELIGREITDVLEQAAANGPRRTPIGERTIDLRTTSRTSTTGTTVNADE